MTRGTDIEQLLNDWSRWGLRQAPSVVETYTAGLNHHTVLVEAGQQQLVLKQFCEPQPTAVLAQQWAADLQLAPDVVFAPADFSYLVMQPVKARDLSAGLPPTGGLHTLGASLQRLHSATPPSSIARLGQFDLIGFCQQYLPSAGKVAQRMHQQLEPALQHYLQDSTPPVLCHNDLVAANCFINGGRAQFIDWEYAQLHNPWFDLAALFYYLRIDTIAAAQLLGAYRDDWQVKVRQPIFTSAQIALLWGDMLWHLARFGEDYWPQLQSKRHDLLRLAARFGLRF